MKTAISIPDDLFQEIEKFSKERHASRSEVFTTAVREYLERIKSQKLLKDLNDAYSVAESAEETYVRRAGKRRYARSAGKERY